MKRNEAGCLAYFRLVSAVLRETVSTEIERLWALQALVARARQGRTLAAIAGNAGMHGRYAAVTVNGRKELRQASRLKKWNRRTTMGGGRLKGRKPRGAR